MNSTLILVIAIVAITLLMVVSIFNNLTNKKNQVSNAFGTIDVQLKNRYDLIPNLVATVQQYTTHEKDLLTRITELRSKAVSPDINAQNKVKLVNPIYPPPSRFNGFV